MTKEFQMTKVHPKMVGTGDPPVPSGDPPLGLGASRKQTAIFEKEKVPSIPSGQWPDGTGESPVLPKTGEQRGLLILSSFGISHSSFRNAELISTSLNQKSVHD